jgi:hypothetical protein
MGNLYDDGRYVLTASALSTPSRIYPLAHVTVRVRRDPFWLALASSALSGAAIVTYGDLLYPHEVTSLIVIPVALLLASVLMGILAIDSPGHPSVFIVTSAGRARRIFAAMRKSKMAEFSQLSHQISHLGSSGN